MLGLTAMLLGALAGSAEAAPGDGACSGGLGDRQHPALGVAGVRVNSYDAHVTVAAGLSSYRADVTMHATTTRRIECLSLDLGPAMVEAVSVNGAPAPATRRAGKLEVRPAAALLSGARADVRVATTTAVPAASAFGAGEFPPGVFRANGVLQTIGQPSRAHLLMAMADHPAQKAPWRIVVDVPRGLAAAVSGRLVSRQPVGDAERFVYATDAPEATHVLQLAVGRLVLIDQGSAQGVHLRSWIPPGDVPATSAALRLIPRHLRFLRARLGPYPFRQYGVLATPAGGELEDQTLSLLATSELRRPEEADSVMLHELTHQWFGDSVSVRRWSDLWLAEGHAVYYQLLYETQAQPGGLRARMRAIGGRLAAEIRRYGPIARPHPDAFTPRALAPYGPVTYEGAALTLYALRRRVGVTRFERIERRFLTRYANSSASTADYLKVVGSIAGRRTGRNLRRWLETPKLPPR